MHDNPVYDGLGVPTVVNAAGTKTRIGGSRMRSAAVKAMVEAAKDFVRLSDLQAAASERIADVTGAEAGYVTNGAAGGLLLATAACIAGGDPAVMARLPDTGDRPNEIVMPRTHRTGYDHALRTAGAEIVDIGTNDRALGTGARDVERWEYRSAFGADTAAVAHVYKAYQGPPLQEVCELAHEQGLPVIVDAAAEVPPADNLAWFTEQGADVVVFSGGKGIRGPQTTGMLAGRADLVESVALQHLDMHAADAVWDPPAPLIDSGAIDGVPRQGIGRPLKVGREEIVGLLAALEAFLDEDEEALTTSWHRRIERIADDLEAVRGLSTAIHDADRSVAPVAEISVDAEAAGIDAVGVVRRLRREDPRVFVGADAVSEGTFTINPMCLTDEEATYVSDRIEAVVDGDR